MLASGLTTTLTTTLLAFTAPYAAAYGALARPLTRASRSSSSMDGLGDVDKLTAVQKLARLEVSEQQRYAAERSAPAPRKSFAETLRIVFLGQRTVQSTSGSRYATATYALPEEVTNHPAVLPPPSFSLPTGRPLAITGDVRTTLSAFIAVMIRLCAGVFVSGWRPCLTFKPPHPDARKLSFLPLYLSDTSRVLRGELRRPSGRLLL